MAEEEVTWKATQELKESYGVCSMTRRKCKKDFSFSFTVSSADGEATGALAI